MDDEQKKALEETEGEGGAPEPTELEKELAEKDALIAKLSVEKENYKRGMLKAKGKAPKEEEEDDSEETEDEKFNRMFSERMLETQIVQANREKDDLLKKALARNKELETAIKNRSQITTTETGSGSEQKISSKRDTVLSAEKLEQLKKMGWDDKKIELYKKNLVKLK